MMYLITAYIVICIGAYFGIDAVNTTPEPFRGAKMLAQMILAAFWPIALIAKFFAYVYKDANI